MLTYRTAAEFAEQCGVDTDTVRGWCATGELRATNVAKRPNAKKPRWRISDAAAAEFLERRTRGPVSSPAPARRPHKKSGTVIQFF